MYRGGADNTGLLLSESALLDAYSNYINNDYLISIYGGFFFNPYKYHVLVSASEYYGGTEPCNIFIKSKDATGDGETEEYYQTSSVVVPVNKIRNRRDAYIRNDCGNAVTIRYLNLYNGIYGTYPIDNNSYCDRTFPMAYGHAYIIE